MFPFIAFHADHELVVTLVELTTNPKWIVAVLQLWRPSEKDSRFSKERCAFYGRLRAGL